MKETTGIKHRNKTHLVKTEAFRLLSIELWPDVTGRGLGGFIGCRGNPVLQQCARSLPDRGIGGCPRAQPMERSDSFFHWLTFQFKKKKKVNTSPCINQVAPNSQMVSPNEAAVLLEHR